MPHKAERTGIEGRAGLGRSLLRAGGAERQYAEEQLLASGEAATVRDRHLAWAVALGGAGVAGAVSKAPPGAVLLIAVGVGFGFLLRGDADPPAAGLVTGDARAANGVTLHARDRSGDVAVVAT